MTTHIKNKIESILFKGGFVNNNLESYIDELSSLRHPNSIENEFSEAITDIESRKGKIHPSHKQAIFNAIEKIWNEYPNGEKELYKQGTTTQIENGVKVTKKYYEFKDVNEYIQMLISEEISKKTEI